MIIRTTILDIALFLIMIMPDHSDLLPPPLPLLPLLHITTSINTRERGRERERERERGGGGGRGEGEGERQIPYIKGYLREIYAVSTNTTIASPWPAITQPQSGDLPAPMRDALMIQ